MTCPHCGSALAADARFCGACGQATSATEPSQAGQGYLAPGAGADLVGREIAGRYRVVAKLGEGGMGAVYRGEQISLKRKVAIKVLRPELSADAGLVRRFNSEAELVAKLSHPNTVNIYDFGQDPGGALFIAMEYLEGRSLRQVVSAEGPLPPVRAIAIARQIAAALSDAHAHGIVHRDLKPDNVMLTERGKERDVVRVLDFGIAKLRDENRATVNAMTRAGDLVGTPQYMAPEQIRGEAVDGRTDVYALGAILYEMVTARLPFEGTTVLAILSKHLTESPPPPSARRPELGLPPALDALVMSALAKDPAHRPASMDRFADELVALGQQLGPASHGFAAPSGPMSSQQPAAGASAFMTPPPPPSFANPPHAHAPHAHAAPQQVASPPPFGRPPGVPRSYPPGVLKPMPMPMPMAPPPYAPPPAAYTPPPYAHGAPPRRGSLLWLWIVLGVLVVGGGVAAVLVLGGKKQDEPAVVEDDDGDDVVPPKRDDWAPEPAPTAPDTPTGGWQHYRHASGWGIDLPPGFPTVPVEAGDGTLSFVSVADGQLAMANMLWVPTDEEITDALYDEAASEIAKQMNAQVIERGWIDTGGERRYHTIVQAGGQTAELRFYEGEGGVLIAVYMRSGKWEQYRAERERFFEEVDPP